MCYWNSNRMFLTFRADTYRTHYTNDSLPQEARVDVICPFSSPLKKTVIIKLSKQSFYIFICFSLQFKKLVQTKAYMKTLHVRGSFLPDK